MAKKVTVTLVDDIDLESTADETVEFALDGVTYEIDLSDANATALRESLATWIASARRSGGRRKTGVRPTVGVRSGASHREETAAIRSWARENGFTVSARGRIPTEVLDAYQKAS
ncbi:histone-like nucleoid-structuring protein Lsr2 [Tomitella biformata]|uniref:histone-like nucleoid-structuring protein Lsr2 n=1 Tax=Tomitella biformata TaxID=630403 RepID=UPI000466AB81|nr:Lsr2 family protein [Tomitella biformata]